MRPAGASTRPATCRPLLPPLLRGTAFLAHTLASPSSHAPLPPCCSSHSMTDASSASQRGMFLHGGALMARRDGPPRYEVQLPSPPPPLSLTQQPMPRCYPACQPASCGLQWCLFQPSCGLVRSRRRCCSSTIGGGASRRSRTSRYVGRAGVCGAGQPSVCGAALHSSWDRPGSSCGKIYASCGAAPACREPSQLSWLSPCVPSAFPAQLALTRRPPCSPFRWTLGLEWRC